MAIIFIIMGGLIIYAIWKNSKAKDVTHKANENIKASILTSTDGKTSHETKTSDYKSYHEQMRVRDKRHERKHTIWRVLRFMVTYKSLMAETTNFYQFRDNYDAFKTAKGEMRKRHPDTNALNTAIRFCRMEYFYETCDHKITDNDIQSLYKWRELNINEEELLNNVLTSFEMYWKEVLASYVRPSARTNRINYLIQELANIKEMKEIQPYPIVLSRIDQIQQQYKDMLHS